MSGFSFTSFLAVSMLAFIIWLIVILVAYPRTCMRLGANLYRHGRAMQAAYREYSLSWYFYHEDR